MPTWINDFAHAGLAGLDIAAGAKTAPATGGGVDFQAGEGLCFGFAAVSGADAGTYAITVQESKNRNVADPEAADPWTPTVPAVTASVSSVPPGGVLIFSFWRSKRWARAVITPSGASTGSNIAIMLAGMRKQF